MTRLRRFAGAIGVIIGLIGLFSGLVTVVDSGRNGGIVAWIGETAAQIVAVMWTRGAVIFVILCLGNTFSLLLFVTDLKRCIAWLKEHRVKASVHILAFIVVQVGITVCILRLMYFDMLPAREVIDLFPQIATPSSVAIRTYGNNGGTAYRFFSPKGGDGPDRGYAEIVFRTFGSTVDYNCGWILFPLRGTDLSHFHKLRFLVSGNEGGERIGVKVKDARGAESAVGLDSPPPGTKAYLAPGGITKQWQEVVIPFDHFGNVDFSLIENVSLFTTGAIAGTREQVLRVGDFRLVE